MNKVIAGCFAIFLAACSTGVPSNIKAGDSKIAVLSFVGGRFNTLENVRPSPEALVQRWQQLEAQLPIRGYDWDDLLAVSETKRWEHDIAEWKIDPYVVSLVADALAPSHQVIPFEHRSSDLGFDGLFEYEGKEFAGKVADAIREQPGFATAKDIDAYVVVLPNSWLLMARQRHSYGLGMFRTFMSYDDSATNRQGSYFLHALYYVMVLDGRSLEMIAGVAARNNDDRQGPLKGHPGKLVDPSYWAADFDSLTSAQTQKLTKEFEALIKESLPHTLQKLELIP
jgi:hypothetical protein